MVYIKMKPGLAHPASLTSFIPHRSFTGLLSASHTGPIRTTHQAYSATPVLQATRLFQISIRQNPPHPSHRSHLKYHPFRETLPAWLPFPKIYSISMQLPHHSLFDITLPYFISSLYLSLSKITLFVCMFNVCLLHQNVSSMRTGTAYIFTAVFLGPKMNEYYAIKCAG